MDTQEAKEAGFTPMQSMQVKIEKLESGFAWLKWSHKNLSTIILSVVGIGFAVMIALMTYLHSDTGKKIDKLDSRIDRIESKLDLLIQKQTSQQEAKQSPAKRQAKR